MLECIWEVMDCVIIYLEKNLYIVYVQNVIGSSFCVGSNQVCSELIVILKLWEDCKDILIDEIMLNVCYDLSEYLECKVYFFIFFVIFGLGILGGFEM